MTKASLGLVALLTVGLLAAAPALASSLDGVEEGTQTTSVPAQGPPSASVSPDPAPPSQPNTTEATAPATAPGLGPPDRGPPSEGGQSTPAAPTSDATVAWGTVGDWLLAHAGWALGALALVGLKRERARQGSEEAPDPEAGLGQSAIDHPGSEGAMLMGNRALAEGEPATAEAWFETALELDDELAIAALCRGLCHVEMGTYDQARAWLSRALDLAPDDGTARYHLARAQALDEAGREAVRTLEPLVQARPDVVEDVREDPVFADVREHAPWRRLVEATQ